MSVNGIELILKSDNAIRHKYLIQTELGHHYVYIDPIGKIKMDSPHAKLFEDKKEIWIRDCKGKYQTHAKRKDQQDYELVTNNRTVRDGDLLVFGPLSSSPSEFRVKLLYTTGGVKQKSSCGKSSQLGKQVSPASSKKDAAPSNPKLRRSRSHGNGSLAPPPTHQFRSLSDSGLPEKVQKLRDDRKEHLNKVSMEAKRRLIKNVKSTVPPMLELARAIMPSPAPSRVTPHSRTPPQTQKKLAVEYEEDIVVLDASSSLLSSSELGLGAEINVDAKLGAQYKNLVSARTRVSTVFLKYSKTGLYSWEMIRLTPKFHAAVIPNGSSFCRDYGDYYVSGVQRMFGHWVLIVFEVHKLEEIDKVEVKIKAHFRDAFDMGVKWNGDSVRDAGWSMQHVVCGCFGYPADILKLSASASSMPDALKFLDKIQQCTPVGVTRKAMLTRYLNSNPVIQVPKDAYQQFLAMQVKSATLELRAINPVVNQDAVVLEKVKEALLTFRSNVAEYFDGKRNGDPDKCRHARKHANDLLSKAVSKTDIIITRYGLIVEAKRLMQRGPLQEVPQVGQKSYVWKWKCGMTGTVEEKTKTDSGDTYKVSQGTFKPHGPNYRTRTSSVCMAAWWFIAREGSRLWPSNMQSEFSCDYEQKHTKCGGDSKGNWLALGRINPVYIIGWTAKCEYVDEDGKPQTGKNGRLFSARIERLNKQEEDAFLPDRLTIHIKSTSRVKCTFQIFFVFKEEYYFKLQL